MVKKLLIIVVLCLGLLTACSNNQKEYIREDVTYKKQVENNSEFYYIDVSQKDLGYILFYTPANWFITMNKDNFEQTLFSAKDESCSYKIPLSYGNGTYEFKLYDPSMNLMHTEIIEVNSLTDKMLYTMSNDVINFSSSDLVSIISSELYMKSESDYDFISKATKYTYEHITYDIENRDLSMFVTPDNILIRGHGVCYEEAKLLTALIRIKNIPCKLVFGYYNNDYHAWCEVFIEDHWVIADSTKNLITSIDNNLYTNKIKVY